MPRSLYDFYRKLPFNILNNFAFKDITVKEIAERAGLDRKTFYRHFTAKEDVLHFYTDAVCLEYITELQKQHSLTTYTIALSYFSVLQRHISFFKKLERNNLSVFLLLTFDTYLPAIHKLFASQETATNSLYDSEYALSYYTGGFWNLSTKWIRDGAQKTPAEMALMVEKIMSAPL
jgi:AcrR family transcriptional regulator